MATILLNGRGSVQREHVPVVCVLAYVSLNLIRVEDVCTLLPLRAPILYNIAVGYLVYSNCAQLPLSCDELRIIAGTLPQVLG